MLGHAIVRQEIDVFVRKRSCGVRQKTDQKPAIAPTKKLRKITHEIQSPCCEQILFHALTGTTICTNYPRVFCVRLRDGGFEPTTWYGPVDTKIFFPRLSAAHVIVNRSRQGRGVGANRVINPYRGIAARLTGYRVYPIIAI